VIGDVVIRRCDRNKFVASGCDTEKRDHDGESDHEGDKEYVESDPEFDWTSDGVGKHFVQHDVLTVLTSAMSWLRD